MPSASYRPLQPKQAACRSCRAPIFWATVLKTGKRMPINVDPQHDGTIILLTPNECVVLGPEEAYHSTDRKFVCHFATCPETKAWRRARDIPEPAA